MPPPAWRVTASLLSCFVYCSAAVSTEPTNPLFEWVREHGGFVDPRLELTTGPDPNWTVRGVFATGDFLPNEVLVDVPQDLRICGSNACGLIRRIREEMIKGSSGFHWPYVKIMLEHNINSPDVWTPEERELLHGLYPTDWPRHTQWFLYECWPAIREEYSLNTLDNLTLKAMHLYVARVTTVKEDFCFIPIYDLLNHRNGPDLNIQWNLVEKQNNETWVKLLTSKGVKAGTQIWNSFGTGAGRMLRDYGFIEQNPTTWAFQASDGNEYTWTVEKRANNEKKGGRGTRRQVAREELVARGVNPAIRGELQQHLDEVLKIELPSVEGMRPDRVELAAAYRENYIEALRLAIDSVPPHSEL